MDGYSLVKALRETVYLADFNGAACLSWSLWEEAFTLKVDDYMVKPIRLEELFTCSSATEKSAVGNSEKVTFSTYNDYNALTLTDLETDTVYQIPKKSLCTL